MDWSTELNTIVTIVAIILGGVSIGIWDYIFVKGWRKKYWKKVPDNYFKNEKQLVMQSAYVRPKITDDNDTPLGDLSHYFIEKVFVKSDKKTPEITCIYGDTAMGKTVALVILFYEYIQTYTKRTIPYQIRLFPMYQTEVLNNLRAIEDKEKCILLLDALDERTEAINDYDKFKKEFEGVIGQFAHVVITCRPQFFAKMKDGFYKESDERMGDGQFIPYKKLFIAPPDEEQIAAFINLYAREDSEKREKAQKIIERYPVIASNMLFLSDIQSFIDYDSETLSICNIYDIIITRLLLDYGLKKISHNGEEYLEAWKKLLSDVAGYMYQHDRLYVTHEEYQTILSDHNLSLPDEEKVKGKEFWQRSLLTRKNDIFQFSHKSFYEYLFVHFVFHHPEKLKSLLGFDIKFIVSIFDELYEEYSQAGEHTDEENSKVAMAMNILGNKLSDMLYYKEAEAEYAEALDIRCQLAEQNPENEEYQSDVANTLNNLAILYWNKYQYKEAEEEYSEALRICRQLAEKSPEAFLPDVAMTLNNLAILHYHKRQYKEAEAECNEALCIYRQLAEQNPEAFLPHVAGTLNNLGNLHKNKYPYDRAEAEYTEALRIRRQLAEKSPEAFLPNVALTLDNQASLHRDKCQYKEAEAEYTEALRIRRQLAKKNPDAFLPDVAMTLNNQATLHYHKRQYKEAEAECNEALCIYRQLAEQNPEAFLPHVAGTLNNLGNLHKNKYPYDRAEAEYTEALRIRRQLAKKNPDAFLPDVATTLNNLAAQHYHKRQYKEAEAEYTEALCICRELAKKNPEAFLPDVAMTLYNMAINRLEMGGDLDIAEAEAQESLEKYQFMAELSPEAFGMYVEKAHGRLEYIRKAKKETKK